MVSKFIECSLQMLNIVIVLRNMLCSPPSWQCSKSYDHILLALYVPLLSVPSSSEGTSQSYDLVLVACWMRNADITTISEVSPRRKKDLQKVLTGTWIGTYRRLRTLSGIWANISHLSEGTSVKHKISMSILELNWAQVGTDKIVDRIGKKLDKYYNKNA